jgi:hypothetical protein
MGFKQFINQMYLTLVANSRRFTDKSNIRKRGFVKEQTTKKTKTEEMQEKATKQNDPKTRIHRCGQVTDTLIPDFF